MTKTQKYQCYLSSSCRSPPMQTFASSFRSWESRALISASIATKCCSGFVFQMADHSQSYLSLYAPASFTFVIIPHCPAISANVKCTNSWEQSCTGPISPLRSTQLCRTVAPAYQTVRMSSDDSSENLFFREGPPEHLEIVILETLRKAKWSNPFEFVRMDRYSNFTKAIKTADTNTTKVAWIFHEHWVENYGIRSRLLTDDGPQIVSKYFFSSL